MGSERRRFLENGFPIRGRKDYPLLFDRSYQPKPWVKEVIEEAEANSQK